MPLFTHTITFRGSIGQKFYWEEVREWLQRKGARIINVKSIAGRVGESMMPVNRITITYEATKEIKVIR